MIDIPTLYLGARSASHALRYGRPPHQNAALRRPVVVWNLTRRCNLACRHCYSDAADRADGEELSPPECRDLIDDLAAFGCPVLLFSGGEPLTRPDLPELAAYAGERGLRTVVSSNGTLIDAAHARALKEAGVAYVGVSIDGLEKVHDRFRGRPGAFGQAWDGIRACREAGLKVGLRYTMTRANAADVDGVFDLLISEGIPRICFYHLVSTGRGVQMSSDAPDHALTRRLIDLIIDRTAELSDTGRAAEVLTVDHPADGAHIYLRMLREGNPRTDEALRLLRANGGSSSGVGIGCVSWDGSVYPDQFWRNRPLGNVRQTPFSRIWTSPENEFLADLRDARSRVTGRCAECRFLEICGGGFRARAEAMTGDPWASDPACYLTDEEIGIDA